MRRLVYMFVWVCEIMKICGWAGVLLLVCVQTSLLPGSIHSSFIAGWVGGIISADACSINKCLSTKLTSVKHFEKKKWLQGWERETKSLGKWTKSMAMVWKPMVWNSPVCLGECQMIIWKTESPDSNTQLENTPAVSSTHISYSLFAVCYISQHSPPLLQPLLRQPCNQVKSNKLTYKHI